MKTLQDILTFLQNAVNNDPNCIDDEVFIRSGNDDTAVDTFGIDEPTKRLIFRVAE